MSGKAYFSLKISYIMTLLFMTTQSHNTFSMLFRTICLRETLLTKFILKVYPSPSIKHHTSAKMQKEP